MAEQAPDYAHPESHAPVIAPPPLIFLGAFLAGLLLDRLRPARLPRSDLMRGGGVLLCLGGLALALWAAITFRRGDTPLEPHQPVRHLMTGGPYQYTRNPIYTAMSTLYLGLSLLLGRLWPLLLLPTALAVLRQGVVLREEAYLEGRFGDEYRAFKASVRRWL